MPSAERARPAIIRDAAWGITRAVSGRLMVALKHYLPKRSLSSRMCAKICATTNGNWDPLRTLEAALLKGAQNKAWHMIEVE